MKKLPIKTLFFAGFFFNGIVFAADLPSSVKVQDQSGSQIENQTHTKKLADEQKATDENKQSSTSSPLSREDVDAFFKDATYENFAPQEGSDKLEQGK